MAPRIVDKAAKRKEILAAAIRVFSVKGVANSKVIDIAREAGIGKGTIYEYFSSKDEIFQSGYEAFIADLNKSLQGIVESSEHPVEKLHQIIETSMTEFLISDNPYVGIMMEFWADGVRQHDERMLKILDMDTMYSEFRNLIAAILKEGVELGVFRQMDTVAVSSILIGALDGIMLQWILNKNNVDPPAVSEALFELLLGGIQ